MIDLYCERVGPGVWAEPLNVSSNVAYVLAAWAVWRRAVGGPSLEKVFSGLLLAIAAGSAAFHLFATPWSRAMDEAPIAAFQAVFLWVYGRRVARLTAAATVASIVVVLGAMLALRPFPEMLNGSLPYVPAWLVAAAIAWHQGRVRPLPDHTPFVAVSVLAAAIAFRSLDASWCTAFPVGTHFIWHALTAVVLWLFVRIVLRARQP